MQDYEQLKNEIIEKIDRSSTLDRLEDVRVSSLGKQGSLSLLMKQLGSIEPDKRRETGQKLNLIQKEVLATIDIKKEVLRKDHINKKLADESVDITLPIRPENHGKIHPLSKTMDEVISIFAQMGFTVAEGPDIESDYYNFSALNIPPEHPARQEHDTFYFNPDKDGNRKVLRIAVTKTSKKTEHVRMSPNASKHIRTRPNKSECI